MLMKPYTEDDVLQAIDAVTNGTSIRQAARLWAVPRGTLSDRINGTQTHQEVAISQQRLSPTQEKYLSDWVLMKASLGLPPTHAELRVLVLQ